jgi:hypothetical protein
MTERKNVIGESWAIPRITGVAPHTLQSFVRERFPALGRVRGAHSSATDVLKQ